MGRAMLSVSRKHSHERLTASTSSIAGSFITMQAVQTVIPDHLPEMKYPPIARTARVQGDVIVSFRETPDGGTGDVTPISGPAMLQGVAVENVKAWHFAPPAEPAARVYKAVFHFQLNPPDDGFDGLIESILVSSVRVNHTTPVTNWRLNSIRLVPNVTEHFRTLTLLLQII